LMMEPEAAIGDYLLIHAGFAIGRVDPEEAKETLALLREMGALEV
jgi:hydrogenase expression/formation protein HypC